MSFHEVTIDCCQCGTGVGLKQVMLDNLKRSGDTFYCPVGHANHFPKVDKVAQLKAESEQLQRRVASLVNEVEREKGRYRCCVAGCDEWHSRKQDMRRHLDRTHQIREVRPMLAANAGPDAKNSEVG